LTKHGINIWKGRQNKADIIRKSAKQSRYVSKIGKTK